MEHKRILLLDEENNTIVHEDDSSSINKNMLLENPADSNIDSYLLQEDYIVGEQLIRQLRMM